MDHRSLENALVLGNYLTFILGYATDTIFCVKISAFLFLAGFPMQYFEHKFTCPSANGTDTSCSDHGLGSEFENYFSVAAMLPIFIMTGANIWLQSK